MVRPEVTPYTKGMAAVYYAAAELSERGYIVTTTARNAPKVDILVTTPDMKKTFNVQVKTTTHSYWIIKDAKKAVSPNFLYIFVKFKGKQKPDFYIVKSTKVARNINIYRSKNAVWPCFSPDEKDKDRWNLLR